MLYIYLRFTRPHSSVPSIIKRECICNCIRFSMQTQKKKQIMKERKKENKIHHHFRRMSGGLSIIGHLLHRSFATATEYLSHIYIRSFSFLVLPFQPVSLPLMNAFEKCMDFTCGYTVFFSLHSVHIYCRRNAICIIYTRCMHEMLIDLQLETSPRIDNN